MKAADIPDSDFLAAVDACAARNGWAASRWHIEWELSGHDPALLFQPAAEGLEVRYPTKVVLAKAKALVKRGLLDGCACGCRGDFRRRPS